MPILSMKETETFINGKISNCARRDVKKLITVFNKASNKDNFLFCI